MSQSVEFNHKIDAKLASNIGEESISNKVQAIAEIKKNSYDADAHNTWLTFEGIISGTRIIDEGKIINKNNIPLIKQEIVDAETYGKSIDLEVLREKYNEPKLLIATDHNSNEVTRKISKIIIRDDGFGMTLEDFQNKFFRIGTDNKQRNKISPENKRRVVGEKGMGHVAIKRLGKVCKIISNPRSYPGREPSTSMDKTIIVNINWADFQHGLDFSEVTSKGEILDRDVTQTTGLQIEITKLNESEYTVEEFRDLQKTLGMLLVPEHLKTKKNDDFRIHFQAPGEDFRMQEIGQAMNPLDRALLKLTGTAKYDKDTDQTNITYFIEKRTESKNSPDGFVWDRLKLGNETFKIIKESGKLFGDAKLVLYHYPQGGFGKWKDEQKTLLERKDIQAFTKKYSGIKIFADNVRLYPFGERGHATMYDWAGVDASTMRAQMGGRIRLDTIVGFLTIERETSIGIREVSTRQGVMDTPEFDALKENFVQFLYSELQDLKAKNTRRIQKTKTFREDKALSRLNLAKKDLQDLIPDANFRAKIEENLKEAQKQITLSAKDRKQYEDDVISEKQMYQSLASLGISALSYEHEIGPKYTMINSLFKTMRKSGSSDTRNFDEDINTVVEIVSEIQAWREYLDMFTRSLGAMEDAHHKKTKINLRQMIEEISTKVTNVSRYVSRNKIAENKIDVAIRFVGPNKTIFANRATLLAVFSNLMINSIKSLKFSGRKNPKIKITVEQNTKEKTLDLSFEDNGNGIPETNIHKIWDAFRSFYPKHGKNKEFRGMGLGLTLCKNIIMGEYHGTIELDKTISDKDNPGKGMARFKISIPLTQLKDNSKSKKVLKK